MRLARICRSSRAAVLETCRDRAVQAGFDPLEAYEPWRPVEWTIGLLDGIHSLGIPYLPAIGMAAWLVRAATLPMNVQSLEVSVDEIGWPKKYLHSVKNTLLDSQVSIVTSRHYIASIRHFLTVYSVNKTLLDTIW